MIIKTRYEGIKCFRIISTPYFQHHENEENEQIKQKKSKQITDKGTTEHPASSADSNGNISAIHDSPERRCGSHAEH